MGDQWYFIRGGKQAGPVSSAELKKLASTGQISPTDLLWKEGLADWVPAAKVKGLFGAQLVVSPTPNSEPPPVGPHAAVAPAQSQPLRAASPMYRFAEEEDEAQANPLKAPAISLIVMGAILALLSLFITLMALVIPQPHMFMHGDAAAKLMVIKALLILHGIVSIALSAIVIVGAIATLKQSSYPLSMTAAICAIVGSLFILWLLFPLAIWAGIWALIVLREPEAKRLFVKA